jgi:hypothetical protein
VLAAGILQDLLNRNDVTSLKEGISQDVWNDLTEMVDNVREGADAARHVLDDALDLEKLAAGNFTFVYEPFR